MKNGNDETLMDREKETNRRERHSSKKERHTHLNKSEQRTSFRILRCSAVQQAAMVVRIVCHSPIEKAPGLHCASLNYQSERIFANQLEDFLL